MRVKSHHDAWTPSADVLILLAAAYLHVPARRLRSLLRGQERDLKEWVAQDTARKVAHARHEAKTAAQRLQKLGGRVVTIDDEAYPPGLRSLEDPPAFLCVRGALPAGGLAIVGSRTPPPAAAAFARELAAACGMPVVSGLASGVDAAAHHGALDAGLATVAYVGTGLGVTYPPEHRALEDEIVSRGGAVASERLPDEPVTKWALAHRDRLQAAHAQATVLVASEIDGGAMQTMRFAKELGRRRYVLDAQGEREYAGNVQARADGAIALPFDVKGALRILHANFRSR
jgi:DNA processing protein